MNKKELAEIKKNFNDSPTRLLNSRQAVFVFLPSAAHPNAIIYPLRFKTIETEIRLKAIGNRFVTISRDKKKRNRSDKSR